MRIIAADDEFLQLNKLERAIKEAAPDAELITFSVGSRIQQWIKEDGKADIAFLDIEMGSVSGITIAKKLQAVNPNINIVFVTGFIEYAPDALNMRASGYVSKPATAKKIQREMENLRFPMPKPEADKKIVVRCFGTFEVFIDGVPVKFKREKAKELLAYLVDKRGAVCSPRDICAVLWEEDKPDYLRKLTQELFEALHAVDADHIFVKRFKEFFVLTDDFTCDYYDYLNNEPYAVKAFHGEYMSQYSWAEDTLATLTYGGEK